MFTSAMSGTFEQHDERNSLLQRQLRDAIALCVASCSDGTSEHREIFSADHHRPSIDETRSSDDRVRWHLAHQRADLTKRAFVEQRMNTSSSIETAVATLLGEAIWSTHLACCLLALSQIGPRVVPVRPVPHGSHGTSPTPGVIQANSRHRIFSETFGK